MDLPIDHFRLLGVSPTTDLQAVLRTLQQRIDRPPEHGFTPDTLRAREELLHSSADLLSDPQRRAHYESELTALSDEGETLQAALDVPASKEVAGLLLLLEADLPLDCFELTSRALQPPQAPALGSGREADLGLLAGLACLQGARDLRGERRYEAASQLLAQGQQLLQRTGQQLELRQQLADERRVLRPYRILDLLSRDLGSAQERSEGLSLLEELVQERGGLDGWLEGEGKGEGKGEGNSGPSPGDLSVEEFQAFFRQIRQYLTVQEQIDLFERWASRSSRADFLAITALTASGFAQRKPERIGAARDRLLARGQADLRPLLACLHLLLGQADSAEALFAGNASEELLEWARRQSSDSLAQVCAYCRQWLARDVLPGYRDLEADPDLEAYFADRDVQAYLDGLEAEASADEVFAPSAGGAALAGAQALLGLGSLGYGDADEIDGDDADREDDGFADALAPRWRRPLLLATGALAALLVGLGLVSLLRPRPAPVSVGPATSSNATNGQAAGAGQSQGKAPGSAAPGAPASGAATAEPPQKPGSPARPEAAALPLRSDQPSAEEIQSLLEAWLAAKASVLAGEDAPTSLEDLAQAPQLRLLRSERRADQSRNQTQRIDASVENLRIEANSPGRVAAVVTIRYRGERLDGEGKAVGQPSNLTLRNRYVFSREGGTWRLVSFERAT
ncbi:ARC6/PARC6 family protein [Cyanobium sp. CH-040]|uniref:ARC6/PARC6 family protein n=1 Tax=Cyanobium sp. CH-040 TaxID=2823708 RepID=UPI0020CC79EB|nr:ARC6/PARC6 family protein [Cyanobium sp. CH-040]MCP9928659.1 ARC6/PARC6 family protein [Cyanobium sp. CH-040]